MKTQIAVARAARQLVTSATGRAWLRDIGFTADSLIVCCAEEDLVRDVVGRARRGMPPAVILFERDSKLSTIVVHPAEDAVVGHQPVHDRITIGMLFDSAKATGETSFRVSAWDGPQTASVPGLAAAQ